MKKQFLLSVVFLFFLGCATSEQKKAENLARDIDEKMLQEEKVTPTRASVRDKQPDHFIQTVGTIVMLPVKQAGKGMGDFIRVMSVVVIEGPVAILQLPFQIVADLFGVVGEFGKALSPPPKPEVK